jgi:hypothetical protein
LDTNDKSVNKDPTLAVSLRPSKILNSAKNHNNMANNLRYGYKCSVPGCATRGDSGLIFHAFPADREKRAIWQNICQISTVKTDNRVCQHHFNESDYMTSPGTRLKREAYPKTESHSDSSMDPLKFEVKVDSRISSTDPLKCVVKVEENKDIIKCSMPICPTKGLRGEFHPFPAKGEIRAKWQNICQLSTINTSSYLCRRHFGRTDYFVAPGTLAHLRLKPGAFPVMFVTGPRTRFKTDSSSKIQNPPTSVVKVETGCPIGLVHGEAPCIIKCAMPLCPTEGTRGKFYPFPAKNSDRRDKWQELCQLSEVEFNSGLCWRHFDKSDFFLAPGTLNDVRLKTGAFPVLHVPKKPTSKPATGVKTTAPSANIFKRYCAVAGCTSRSVPEEGFHCFPEDPDLRAKWLNICQLSGLRSTHYVCQLHFNKSDYDIAPGTLNDLNEEMKPRLKTGAFPVLHVPRSTNLTLKDAGSYRRCSVPICKTKGVGIFHRFPTNPFFRAKWQKICYLPKLKTTTPGYVCQRHFEISDYMIAPGTLNDLNEEIRPRLNKGAFPVLHLPKKNSEPAPIIMATPSRNPTQKISNYAYARRVCSVPLCTTKGVGGYHTFPANPYFRAKWQKICQLSKVKKSNFVCQRHFKKSDYMIAPGTLNDLNEPIKPRLNIGAFPVLHVPKNDSTNDLSDSISSTDPLTFVKVEDNVNTDHNCYHCSVPLCKTRGAIDVFHNFPENPDLREKWQNICQLSKVKFSSVVCQRHFDTSDYLIAPGTLNDLNKAIKPRLNIGAFPVLHVSKNAENVITDHYCYYCSVPLCKTRGAIGVFHNFPENPDLRAKWQNICQLSKVKYNDRVCLRHFDTSDYQIAPGTLNDLKKAIKPRLNIGAFPVLYVPKNESINDLSASIETRLLSTFVDHRSEKGTTHTSFYCCVPLCKTKGSAGFHSFPSNPALRAKWQNICQVSKANSRICHRHFKKSDYMGRFNDLESLMTHRFKRLKIGTCPSLHVPNHESANYSSDSNSSMDPLTCVVKVEENDIGTDTIDDLNEEKIEPRPSDHATKRNYRFKCAVSLCTTKAYSGGGFHTFPHPANPDLRAKWLNICQASPTTSDRVCQRHFKKSDYVIAPGTLNDLNEEMRPKLKKGACPSLHVPKNESLTNDLSHFDATMDPLTFDVKVEESTNALSYADSRMDQQTFVVREVEENVFNEDIKPSLEIGAFPVVLHVPNESIDDLSDDADSSMDPLAVTVKMEN